MRGNIALAVVSIIVLAGAGFASAQRAGQRVSPHESVTATIDGADLTIVYGRPSMRGRKIFGALVPYGRIWCPGADEATTLESTRALQVGTRTTTPDVVATDVAVPSGPHTIWILPTAEAWTLIITKEASGFHTRYPVGSDLGRIEMRKSVLTTPVEQLTFAIEKNPAGAGGVIKMMWETTEVSVPFTVVVQ